MSGQRAHAVPTPGEHRVPSPSSPQCNSFFPPPAFSHLPVCLHLSMCLHANSTDGGWVPWLRTGPDSQFELIIDGLHALLTTRRAREQRPPYREGSLLHKTHSYPVTKNDKPGTPPGISGGFLMQHLGRIFVPGFALSWFLKHIHIQAWASSPPACARAFLYVKS